MQTFLPFKDFDKSAQVLDNKRLNKQILEGYQILKVLSSDDPKAGWRNHPAVKMWRGHEKALLSYVMSCVDEANKRGIRTENNVANIKALFLMHANSWGDDMPEWFSNESILNRVVTTHRANLYIKDPIYYPQFLSSIDSQYNQPCCEKCNYYWVTHVS
jgi:Pyrimidine dimer DNA glycosylase